MNGTKLFSVTLTNRDKWCKSAGMSEVLWKVKENNWWLVAWWWQLWQYKSFQLVSEIKFYAFRPLVQSTSGESCSVWSCECTEKSIKREPPFFNKIQGTRKVRLMFAECKQKLKLNGTSNSCQPTANNAPSSTQTTIQFSMSTKVSISDAFSPSLIPIKFIGMTVNEVLFSLHSHQQTRPPQKVKTRKSLKAIQRQVESRNRFHYKVERDFLVLTVEMGDGGI